MIEHARRVSSVRGVCLSATMILAVAATGCYTRQIEGIQRDLDVIDRKIHKSGSTQSGGASPAISSREIEQIKKELEMVRNQQLGLTSDLETLKTSGVDLQQFGPSASLVTEPFPSSIDAAAGPEIETLRRQIADNQKQIDRFDRELKAMQATFDDVRSSMLDVIELLKEEYIEEGYPPTPASGTPSEGASLQPSASPSVSLGGPDANVASGGSRTYTVQAGDTLNHIASRHGVTLDELKEYNQIANPNQLLRGQTIYIP